MDTRVGFEWETSCVFGAIKSRSVLLNMPLSQTEIYPKALAKSHPSESQPGYGRQPVYYHEAPA
jgi:hypothetical protein